MKQQSAQERSHLCRFNFGYRQRVTEMSQLSENPWSYTNLLSSSTAFVTGSMQNTVLRDNLTTMNLLVKQLKKKNSYLSILSPITSSSHIELWSFSLDIILPSVNTDEVDPQRQECLSSWPSLAFPTLTHPPKLRGGSPI